MSLEQVGIRISGTVYTVPTVYTSLPADADINDLLDFEFEILGNALEHFDCPMGFRTRPARFCYWVHFVEDDVTQNGAKVEAYDVTDAQLVARSSAGAYLIYVDGGL